MGETFNPPLLRFDPPFRALFGPMSHAISVPTKNNVHKFQNLESNPITRDSKNKLFDDEEDINLITVTLILHLELSYKRLKHLSFYISKV